MRRRARGLLGVKNPSPAPSPGESLPGGLPRNYARPCLLLLLAEGASHGYELLEQVHELGLDRIDAGGLYRTLRAMEQEDLVHSWWEYARSGPARRTYALTDEGLEWLHAWAGSLRHAYRDLGHYLDRYEALVEAEHTRRA